jgi:hypothetical protein
MPGMGHKMPKDKKAKKTSYDENITKTMAQGRSGLYQDRDENGKLPQDRVKLHYDRTGAMQDAKMEQMKEIKQGLKNVKAGFEYGGQQAAREAGAIYDSLKEGTKTAYDAAKKGMKTVAKGAKDFIKGFDDRAQPTSNISRR